MKSHPISAGTRPHPSLAFTVGSAHIHNKTIGYPAFHKPRTATGIRRRKVKKAKKKVNRKDSSDVECFPEEGEDSLPLEYEGSINHGVELVSLSTLSSLSYQVQ